jgi:exodeoxyribonuclease VII small subunit
MAKKEKKESFEQALARLEEIAAKLEQGEMPLEDALKEYEEGVKAYRHCSALLKEVQRKIEILTRDEEGELTSGDAEGLDPSR